MNYTEKLNKVKELFSQISTALAGPAPEAPATPAPNMPAGNQYTLADGTPVTIEELEVGKPVTINGQPAPEGTHTLQDGTQITVDASGIISAITPAVSGDMSTPEAMRKAAEKFAAGTPEQRIQNLEIVAKAVMEYCFGWEMRRSQEEADRNNAIAVFKQGFSDQVKDKDEKITALEKTVEKYGEIMPQIFEMLAELGNAPAANPIPEVKISKADQKEASLQKFASAVKELSKSN